MNLRKADLRTVLAAATAVLSAATAAAVGVTGYLVERHYRDLVDQVIASDDDSADRLDAAVERLTTRDRLAEWLSDTETRSGVRLPRPSPTKADRRERVEKSGLHLVESGQS